MGSLTIPIGFLWRAVGNSFCPFDLPCTVFDLRLRDVYFPLLSPTFKILNRYNYYLYTCVSWKWQQEGIRDVDTVQILSYCLTLLGPSVCCKWGLFVDLCFFSLREFDLICGEGSGNKNSHFLPPPPPPTCLSIIYFICFVRLETFSVGHATHSRNASAYCQSLPNLLI